MLGRKRYTGTSGYARSSEAIGVPPRIDAIALALPCVECATSSSCAGLWASSTTSARSATSPFDSSASPPSSDASACAFSGTTSATSTGSPNPRARAEAMFPAPIRPICIAAKDTSGPGGLRLVEEALLDQARPLLRGYLHVAGREEEHLVGDALHAAVERVGEAGREVDQPLGKVGVRALQVEDHGDLVLELVRHLLSVVEVLGDHEVDLHPVAAAVLHRAQDARAAPLARRRVLVGEDVVDLVTATARGQAADVRTLAVALIELLLGLDLVLVVRVLVLGQSEVDERTVPCVA